MRQERGRGALFGGAMAKKDENRHPGSLPAASARPINDEDSPLKGVLSMFDVAPNASC